MDGVNLQVGGGTSEKKASGVESWVVGLNPTTGLLQELWEMELKLHSWTKGYAVGVKVAGRGLGVLLRTWLIKGNEGA